MTLARDDFLFIVGKNPNYLLGWTMLGEWPEQSPIQIHLSAREKSMPPTGFCPWRARRFFLGSLLGGFLPHGNLDPLFQFGALVTSLPRLSWSP